MGGEGELPVTATEHCGFVHLHNHSEYSLLDGANRIPDLVGAAQACGMPALALTVNSSVVTAIANDYAYDVVFLRQLEAQAHAGDVVVGITTSGNSANVLHALAQAGSQGLRTVVLTGRTGGKTAGTADVIIKVPSDATQQIQESHIAIGHVLCELAEQALFPA